jgi:hypothetical protein
LPLFIALTARAPAVNITDALSGHVLAETGVCLADGAGRADGVTAPVTATCALDIFFVAHLRTAGLKVEALVVRCGVLSDVVVGRGEVRRRS